MAFDKHKMDLTTGNIPLQVLKYMVPSALAFLLQMVFHATDVAVVGHFAADAKASVAAVGGPGPVISLLSCLFIGFSAGINAVTARFIGAQDHRNVSRCVHTAVVMGVILGAIILLLGFLIGKPFLHLLKVPSDVLDSAYDYLVITLLGMPGLVMYNFGCAILRSRGDTKRPMWYLGISGVINAVLNVLFVAVFHLDVKGVALATAISKYAAALMVIYTLMHTPGACKFSFAAAHIDVSILKKFLYNGIPAGVQSGCFGVANMLVFGALNSFGAEALAASTVCMFPEHAIYAWTESLHQTALSFAGQNLGAKKYSRITGSFRWCFFYMAVICLIMGITEYLNIGQLVELFMHEPNEKVLEYARIRGMFVLLPCILSGLQSLLTGVLRGLGYAIFPAVAAILGVCVYRVLWILYVFPFHHTYNYVVVTFPVSYIIVAVLSGITLFFVLRKFKREFGQPEKAAAAQ